MTTSVQKTTRLTNPRRLRRKRRQARALGLCEAAWTAAGVGAGMAPPVAVWSGSIKFDSGIDPDITQIRNQFGDEADQREDEERAEHDGIVAADDALVAEQPEAIEGKQRLDQE